MSTANLLVFHGSSNIRQQLAAQKLTYLVRQQLETSPLHFKSTYDVAKAANYAFSPHLLSMKPKPNLVATGYLELADRPLPEKIMEVAQQAQREGFKELCIFPLLLSPGVHVTRDIPQAVALARQLLKETVALKILPHLGTEPLFQHLLVQKFTQLNAEARIFVAHGSRLAKANQTCEAIASQLNALVAYTFVSPPLTAQITTLVQKGIKSIAILPYFLFPGGTTEAIAAEIQQLQQTYPQVKLIFGEPIGATLELAKTISHILQI